MFKRQTQAAFDETLWYRSDFLRATERAQQGRVQCPNVYCMHASSKTDTWRTEKACRPRARRTVFVNLARVEPKETPRSRQRSGPLAGQIGNLTCHDAVLDSRFPSKRVLFYFRNQTPSCSTYKHDPSTGKAGHAPPIAVPERVSRINDSVRSARFHHVKRKWHQAAGPREDGCWLT